MPSSKKNNLGLSGSKESKSLSNNLEDNEPLKTNSLKKPSGVPVYLPEEVREALDVIIFSKRRSSNKPSINSILLEGLGLWFEKNYECTLQEIEEGTKSFDLQIKT